MTDPPDESESDAQDAAEAENNKPPKLTFPDIHCPYCNYCLTGLTEPVCPECGQAFSPGWLYSSEYRYGWRWTKGKVAIAILFSLIIITPMVLAVFGAPDGGFGCLSLFCITLMIPGLGLYAMKHFSDK